MLGEFLPVGLKKEICSIFMLQCHFSTISLKNTRAYNLIFYLNCNVGDRDITSVLYYLNVNLDIKLKQIVICDIVVYFTLSCRTKYTVTYFFKVRRKNCAWISRIYAVKFRTW